MGLYENCRELPIHNFFELHRTKDFKYLVKSGRAGKKALEEKYMEIMDEYNTYFNNPQKSSSEIKQKNLVLRSLKLMSLEVLYNLIETRGITEDIRTAAKKLKIKPEKLKDYIAGLKNEITRLENEMQNSENEQEKDINSLEKTLILVKENGFNFDRFTTPVIEFVFAINRLDEKSRKQMERQRSRR